MRKFLLASLLMASMAAIGCDRTVSEHEKTTSGPNGTTTTQDKTVQHSDGTVSTEKQVQHNP
jgi:hypothetical protein